MNEQEIDRKYDEILMFIYEGKLGIGRNIFVNAVRAAIGQKLDKVIEILMRSGADSMIEEIQQLKNN